MKIQFIRNIEKKVKSRINKLRLKQSDFTIISNNCWGTFIYKKFGLPYSSPFVNLLIYAPDYIKLLENFSEDIFKQDIYFIPKEKSKYIQEMKELGHYDTYYPIGILANIELHFLHYKTEQEAQQKWIKRCNRINFNKLIFKFSDGNCFKDEYVYRFNSLKFKNKIFFSSKQYLELTSVVTLKKFKEKSKVIDEWKHSHKEFNILKFLNNLT